MDELLLLNNEEKFLLVDSCLSLLFTLSFTYSYFKVFRQKMNYKELPIFVICFGYFNNLVWYFYSDLIYHDYMKMVYIINCIFSLILILIYLKYEFSEDKIDSFLNFLIIIIASWAIKKLMIDILNDEDKVKVSCLFSTISLLIALLEWIIKAYRVKNKNILNIFCALSLICVSICRIIFGLLYDELFSFLVSNIIGLIIAFIYIVVWLILKRKYRDVPEEIKENINDKDIKNEKNDETTFKKVVDEEKEKIVKKNK